MNYLPILCLLSVGVHVKCAPITTEESPKTFYDAILRKCPPLLASYKNEPIFTACQNWKAISEVNKLTDNPKDIRCLFYFESFTQYCTRTPIVNTTVSNSVLIQYSIDTICDYAKNSTNKNLSVIFSKADTCKQICLDDMGYVQTVCSTSYYFGHIATTPVVVVEQDHDKGKQASNDNQDAVNQQPEQSISEHQDKSTRNKVAATGTEDKVRNPSDPFESAANPTIIKNSNKAAALPGAGEDTTPENKPATQEEAQHIDAPPQDNDVNPIQNQKIKSADGANGAPEKQSPPDASSKQVNAEETPASHNVFEGQNPDTVNPRPDVKPVQSSPKEVENDNNEEILVDNEEDKVIQNLQGNGDTEIGDNDESPDGADNDNFAPAASSANAEKDSKPVITDESEAVNYNTEMDGDSYFFTYFMLLCIIFIVGYVCYHNKQKILALILEGRRGKRQYRGRRPNSANYHKLDSNLEEAITSTCKKNTNNVIY